MSHPSPTDVLASTDGRQILTGKRTDAPVELYDLRRDPAEKDNEIQPGFGVKAL